MWTHKLEIALSKNMKVFSTTYYCLPNPYLVKYFNTNLKLKLHLMEMLLQGRDKVLYVSLIWTAPYYLEDLIKTINSR